MKLSGIIPDPHLRLQTDTGLFIDDPGHILQQLSDVGGSCVPHIDGKARMLCGNGGAAHLVALETGFIDESCRIVPVRALEGS